MTGVACQIRAGKENGYLHGYRLKWDPVSHHIQNQRFKRIELNVNNKTS